MRRTLLVAACLVIVAAAGSAVPVGRTATNSTGYSVRLTIKGAGMVILETRHPGCNCHFKVRARRSCSSLCHFTVKTGNGTQLRLVAAPATSWGFVYWRGCTVEIRAVVCHLRYPHTGRVTATFAAPGSRKNPARFGTPVFMPGNGLRITVNSATRNADAEVEAVTDQHGNPVNRPPPSGFHYAVVNMTVNKPGLGGYADGSSNRDGFQGLELLAGPGPEYWSIGTPGAHWCQPPSLDLSSDYQVPAGQTATGNLCFLVSAQALTGPWSLIAFDDLSTPGTYWFALR